MESLMLESSPLFLQCSRTPAMTFNGQVSLNLAPGFSPHKRPTFRTPSATLKKAGELSFLECLAALRGSVPHIFEPPTQHEPTQIQAPALTHLELRNLTSLTDDAIEAVAEYLGGLRELSLYGCRRLTDRAFGALCGLSCPNLKWLNHNGAYKIKDAAVHSLLSSHPKLLLYNQPGLFGSEQHGADAQWGGAYL